MQPSRKVSPNQDGIKKLLDQYGAKLVCVRYRYERQQRSHAAPGELAVDVNEPYERTRDQHH